MRCKSGGIRSWAFCYCAGFCRAGFVNFACIGLVFSNRSKMLFIAFDELNNKLGLLVAYRHAFYLVAN